eukprot:2920693-Rhodomonas_salina.3
MRGALQREFVAGKLDKAGAITLVLDILVQDSEEGQVQQMLHMTPAFRNEIYHVCGVTGRRFGVLPVFGGAKGTPSPCYMCGRSIVAAMLTAGPPTRLPEFGYEVGRDEIMDVLLRVAPPPIASGSLSFSFVFLVGVVRTKRVAISGTNYYQPLVRAFRIRIHSAVCGTEIGDAGTRKRGLQRGLRGQYRSRAYLSTRLLRDVRC